MLIIGEIKDKGIFVQLKSLLSVDLLVLPNAGPLVLAEDITVFILSDGSLN